MDIGNLIDILKALHLNSITPEEVLSYLLKVGGHSLSDFIFVLGELEHSRGTINDEEWSVISRRFENVYATALKRRVGSPTPMEKALKNMKGSRHDS